MSDSPKWTAKEQAEFEKEFAKEQSAKRGNGSIASSSGFDEAILTNARGGPPAANLDNAVTILESHPQFKNIIRYDEFLNRLITETPPREWVDADDLTVTLFIQRRCGLGKMSRDTVTQAILLLGHRNQQNCVREWMDARGQEWDGVPRIDNVFEDHFGTPATSYTRAVSKNFWLSMVARIYRPGCQVDNMIVLEGKQGTMKSSALRIIGGEWFTEQHESATNLKAFAEIIQGKMLIEISEMDSFVRSDMTKVKQVITNLNDRYREPYGKHARDHPRQCVFAGTTNRDDWNRDETGARRFWPIRCNGVIDCAALATYRDQYFAEAVHRYRAGESWWTTPEVETRNEQDARYIAPAWIEPIERYIEYSGSDRRSFPLTQITVPEILELALKIPTSQWTKAMEMRVAECLKRLEFSRGKRRIDGIQQKYWFKESPEEQ